MSPALAIARNTLSPYQVIDGFLGPAAAQALLAWGMSREVEFHAARVGAGKGRHDPSLRVARALHGLGPFADDLRSRLGAALLPALDAFGIPQFEPVRQEVELVAHGDGAFFGRHVDTEAFQPEAASDRVVTAVYYLHAQPKAFSGGALRLYPILPQPDGGLFVDIEPEHDRLVLFPAWAPHEVRPVSCPGDRFADSRFAVNCWFHRARSR